MIKTYTIADLAKLSNLSKKEIRKHLIANSIRNTSTASGYKIDELDLGVWLSNIPDIRSFEKISIFNDEIEGEAKICQFAEKDIKNETFSINWKDNQLNGIKFADLFCGAGGLSLGLVMAGYEPVIGVEINCSAYKTYLNNLGQRFKKLSSFQNIDITNDNNKIDIVDYLKSENVNIICGGFPCQGFSVSGSRVISDPRNTLYRDMFYIVKEVQPDYIIMENVVGLTTIYGGKILKKIINDYSEIGYRISIKELNAADYGVAQIRKRVLFIGNRVNKQNIYPSKIISSPDLYVTCGEILDKYINMPEDKSFSHIFSRHSKEMQERLLAVKPGDCLYENYQDSWRKCPRNKPSCTIKGNHGATNIHYELPRVITPREMAALQSFPDDYLFYGTKQSQLVQIGNAVPPFVARAIGIALRDEILS